MISRKMYKCRIDDSKGLPIPRQESGFKGKFRITNFMVRRWSRIINFKGKYRFTDSMMRRTEWRIRDCLSRISWTWWIVFEFNQDKLRYQFIRPNCHFRHLRNFIVISTRPLNSQRSQCTNSRRPRRWHSRIGFPRNCNIVSEMLVMTMVIEILIWMKFICSNEDLDLVVS